MRPKQQVKARHDDLFRARLDQIINMKHALVALADKIEWAWIDDELAGYFSDEGRPAEPVRFMIGMLILKHTYTLSDEQVWDRWVHDPYFQYFTGEEFFQHDLPHERSGMSHWRKRIGGCLDIVLQESLRIAHDTGALIWRGSRSIPPCSPRTSPSRPMPGSWRRRSGSSADWPRNMM
jgi:IS5 family transposase